MAGVPKQSPEVAFPPWLAPTDEGIALYAIFKEHLAVVKDHVAMLETAEKCTIPESKDAVLMNIMVHRGRRLVKQTLAAASIVLKAKVEDEPNEKQSNGGAVHGSTTDDKKPNGAAHPAAAEDAAAAAATSAESPKSENAYFFVDTKPTPVKGLSGIRMRALKRAMDEKSAATEPETTTAKKAKTKKSTANDVKPADALPEIEFDDISDEVDARMKAKEEKRKRKAQKKRKRGDDQANGVHTTAATDEEKVISPEQPGLAIDEGDQPSKKQKKKQYAKSDTVNISVLEDVSMTDAPPLPAESEAGSDVEKKRKREMGEEAGEVRVKKDPKSRKMKEKENGQGPHGAKEAKDEEKGEVRAKKKPKSRKMKQEKDNGQGPDGGEGAQGEEKSEKKAKGKKSKVVKPEDGEGLEAKVKADAKTNGNQAASEEGRIAAPSAEKSRAKRTKMSRRIKGNDSGEKVDKESTGNEKASKKAAKRAAVDKAEVGVEGEVLKKKQKKMRGTEEKKGKVSNS
ncbi:MAG: hypothetical protein M1826_004204 [Phylliscum demangeonii]|nr:MAG: hypothetical protein M1826_004204 [Phylliscum demangeonii]